MKHSGTPSVFFVGIKHACECPVLHLACTFQVRCCELFVFSVAIFILRVLKDRKIRVIDRLP